MNDLGVTGIFLIGDRISVRILGGHVFCHDTEVSEYRRLVKRVVGGFEIFHRFLRARSFYGLLIYYYFIIIPRFGRLSNGYFCITDIF